MKMNKLKNSSKKIKEDLIFAKRTEKAWQRYDKGEFIEMDFDSFIKEIKKW